MATDLTENNWSNVDVMYPGVEIVQFTSANTADYYDCKKIKRVEGAFASQQTTDGEEIQVSWAQKGNGQPRVTLTFETQTVVSGTLTIFGRQ
jgi:hypothetical protein